MKAAQARHRASQNHSKAKGQHARTSSSLGERILAIRIPRPNDDGFAELEADRRHAEQVPRGAMVPVSVALDAVRDKTDKWGFIFRRWAITKVVR